MNKEVLCKGEKCPVRNACQRFVSKVNNIVTFIRHCTNQKLFERKYE
jgi:hypothetical protein